MFNKDAMTSKDVDIDDEMTAVVKVVDAVLVEEASSTVCCGWNISLQIFRRTPVPAPAKSEASASKSPELSPPSKVESV